MAVTWYVPFARLAHSSIQNFQKESRYPRYIPLPFVSFSSSPSQKSYHHSSFLSSRIFTNLHFIPLEANVTHRILPIFYHFLKLFDAIPVSKHCTLCRGERLERVSTHPSASNVARFNFAAFADQHRIHPSIRKRSIGEERLLNYFYEMFGEKFVSLFSQGSFKNARSIKSGRI